jgi:diacylglycerol kinase (ATP)
MSRKFIYFINPISGTKGKDKLLVKIAEKTKEKNIPFEILPTNAEGNYYFLKEKIDKEDITDIIICGGDGTVSKVAAALIDLPVNVGIIPMGSGNGLALAAKIPRHIDKALEVIFLGKAAYIDSFFINTTFSCMLCGLGFDAQVAHDFAKQKERGLYTYIRQTLSNFMAASPYSFDIVHKGKPFSAEAYFISIANSNQFGNQFTIAPKASLSDGLLDIVIVKKMSKLRVMLAVLNQVINGKINGHDDKKFHQKDIIYFQTDKLIIYNNDNAPLHVVNTGRKFYIQVIPKAFKLIQP